jgi:hypothetical protein
MRVIAPQIVDINGVQLITKLNELLTTTTAGSYPTTNNSQNVILSNSSYGDIYISGDILMPSTVSASGKYPYLYIITKGADIYINRNVKEVDAVLIAEPDSKGNGGNIYTCDSTSPKATDFGPGGCNTPLTIKGALLAKRVNLLRSSLTYTGSILNNVDGSSESAKNSTGCEDPSTFKGGEQICFSPLIWLNDPFTPTSLTSLDYLQNLPATL